MKNAIVNIKNQTVTINDQMINFTEAGLYNATDNDDIIEHLEEQGYEVQIEQYEELEKILDWAEINTDFTRGCGDYAEFDFSYNELEIEGWVFDDDHESVSNALGLSFEEAKKYNNENYSIRIKVNEIGKTLYYSHCDNPKSKYNNESSDSEETGNDNQTIIDIINLKNI